jgi:DUF971 family protein
METEDNNKSSTADELSSGSKIEGQLSSSSDVDWFKYTTTGAASLDLTFDLPTASYSDYFSIQMQAADGTVLSGVETGRDGTLSASVSEAGTYYVKVTDDYYHDSGQYNITLTEATYDSNYERENNGYGGSGTRLTSSQKMSGQLFSSSDVDFFNITADQAGTLTVQFDAPTDSYSDYFKVTLQDSSFNTLSAIETGKDAEISAAVESAGTYWVKIEDDYYHDDGVYSVTASLSNQTGNVETEDNNKSSTADELSSGSKIEGQLSSSSDVDWFKYTTTGAASLDLTFDLPTASYSDYFSIQMQAADGTVLSGVETGRDGTLSASVSEAGTYYVKVTDDYYHDSGQYNITLTEATYDSNYERENNGYGGSGTRLTSSQKMSGQLFSSSDVDFFNITADQAGTLTVQFDAPTDSYSDYFKVTLQDSSFNTLSAIETGKDAEISAAVESAGTYWVKIEDDYYHDDGVYSVTASLSNQTGNVETEDNNKSSTADELSSGSKIEGQLSSSSDVDWFKYTTTGAASLDLTFDLPTASYSDYFSIQMQAADGTVLSGVETGRDGTLSASVSEAGTYYVKVTDDYYHDSGQYNITLTEATYDSNYERENNGYGGSGTRLTSSQKMSGQLFSSSDVDFFNITADQAGTLTVQFDAPTDSYSDYFKVTLQDSSFNTLSAIETGKDAEISAAVESAGTYWVKIEDDYYHDDGVYSVTASLSNQTGNVETEDNNKSSTADELSSGSKIEGQLSSSSDVDWFKYTTTGAASLDLTFDLPTASYSDYFSIQMQAADGTVLSGVETGRDGTLSASVSEAGTYYVKVTDDYYHDSGQYNITLTEATYDSNYERENNGYGGSGTRLTSSQKMSGQLFSSSDVDFFNITADQAGTLTVQFDAPTDSYSDYFKVTLQDSSFNTLSAIETGKDAEISAAVESAGTYWVKIEDDYYHDDGVYSVTASLSNQTGNVETEDNNKSSTADELSSGSKIEGQLSSSSDVDWFKYTTTGAASLDLTFDLPTASYSDYFSIQMQAADGTVLSGVETGRDGTLSASVSEAGTYYVKVTDDYYHDSGQYSISRSRRRRMTPIMSASITATAVSGSRLTSGQKMSGQLFSSSDVDFFNIIVADQAGTLTVQFDAPTDSYSDYFKVTLQDSELQHV